jgi:23S rRNA C2498 (ribose-2'-O)-methylase RlmM
MPFRTGSYLPKMATATDDPGANPVQGCCVDCTPLVLFCRPGFEPELAAEVAERAGALGYAGYPQTERGSGFVRFAGLDHDAATALDHALPFRDLIFARQKLLAFADLDALPPQDRLGPMLEATAVHAASATATCGSSIRIRMRPNRSRASRAASAMRCARRCARPAC